MPWIVYETTNLINGKKYRGVHKQDGEEFDGYLGSGDLIILAIEKHGRENFLRATMFVFEEEGDAYACESAVVDKAWCERTDTYNIKTGGSGGFPWNSQEFRDKASSRMSDHMKKRHADPEYKAIQSARMKSQNRDPNFKARVSSGKKALHSSSDFKQKQSALARSLMTSLNQDPEFRARASDRMKIIIKALHADPAFRQRHSQRSSLMMKAINARKRLRKANTMLVIID